MRNLCSHFAAQPIGHLLQGPRDRQALLGEQGGAQVHGHHCVFLRTQACEVGKTGSAQARCGLSTPVRTEGQGYIGGGGGSLLPHLWCLLSLWNAAHPMKAEAPSITPSTNMTQGCQGCQLTAETRNGFHLPEHRQVRGRSASLSQDSHLSRSQRKYLSGQRDLSGLLSVEGSIYQSWGRVGDSQKGNSVRQGQGQRPERQCRGRELRT